MKISNDKVDGQDGEIYEVGRVYNGKFLITSSSYDKKFKYSNCFMINLETMKSIKILKIYFVPETSQVIFNGLETQVELKDMIYLKITGYHTVINLFDLNNYQLAFCVRDKMCVLMPNFKEKL